MSRWLVLLLAVVWFGMWSAMAADDDPLGLEDLDGGPSRFERLKSVGEAASAEADEEEDREEDDDEPIERDEDEDSDDLDDDVPDEVGETGDFPGVED